MAPENTKPNKMMHIGVMNRDAGKEHGNYYSIIGQQGVL